MGQEAVGPARRLGRTLPSLSTDSVRDFAAEIWNRNRYGTVSTGMIREFPAFGVGVGSFHFLMSGYVQQFSPGAGLIPDNAQNWYRHQVAEVGFVGSLGWMAWVFAFGWFVMQRHPGAPPAAWPARAALVAFAAVSFVGMPAQDLFVAVTFWTMAFWYVSIVGAPGANVPVKPLIWPATALVVFVFAAGTGLSAVGDLRVPHRAQRSGWPYSYGFYPPEPDGAGGHRRWAGRRAAAVVPATTRWMALTASVDHLAIGSPGGAPRPSHSPTRPVDAKVWSDGTLIVDERLTTTAPVTRLVEVPADEKWVLIETWVSRTIDPRDLGIADDRELGLLVSWTFLDAPPERLTRALE
jgi:hypothetical protein